MLLLFVVCLVVCLSVGWLFVCRCCCFRSSSSSFSLFFVFPFWVVAAVAFNGLLNAVVAAVAVVVAVCLCLRLLLLLLLGFPYCWLVA